MPEMEKEYWLLIVMNQIMDCISNYEESFRKTFRIMLVEKSELR